MIIKLTKAEKKVLQVLDPEQSGVRSWMSARDIAGGVFSRKTIEQEHIRTVRNSFRKIVREGLLEMSPEERGKYRISLKGRKALTDGEDEFEGTFSRGEATEAAKAAAAERMERFGTKPTKGDGAPKEAKTETKAKKKVAKKATGKAAKKATTRKAPTRKAAAADAPAKKKATKAKATKAKPERELNEYGRPTRRKKGASMLDKAVDDIKAGAGSTKADEATEAKKNGESKSKRKFTRREPVTYAEGSQN